MTTSQSFLDNLRRNLGRQPGDPLPERPPVFPPPSLGAPAAALDKLLGEINALAGKTCRLADPLEASLDEALAGLVQAEQVKVACAWQTPEIQALRVEERLQRLGVEIVPPGAGKHALARCDLGVTGADFAVPETGTLGLLSSAQKPRMVSLVPRIHLALITPTILRPGLQALFAEAKLQDYLILITGPSRTSDIELTLTLGVHGPKALYVWVY